MRIRAMCPYGALAKAGLDDLAYRVGPSSANRSGRDESRYMEIQCMVGLVNVVIRRGVTDVSMRWG